MNERIPAEVFPPGEFLRDELEARGWTQTEFANIIGRPPRLVNELLGAKRAITPETARELSAALGTSAQFWMNLETAYQLSKLSPVSERISKEAAIREQFPVREMKKRGWLGAATSYADIETGIRRFFGLNDIGDAIHFPHAARRDYGANLTTLQWAWLFRVQKMATALRVAPYSVESLRATVPELEGLMMDPEAIRHVPRILAECGVRFVIVEPIPGSKIQGVCFWINDGKSPVIGLTLKGDHIDKFWFDLWHEITHVLRGDGKEEPILDDFEDGSGSLDEIEKAANESAANHCVPTRLMLDFIARHNPMYSEKSLIGFSRIVKRHPGIVAGQIQKKTNRWDLFKKHQPRVRNIIIEAALTDGYGKHGPIDI
jgi:HTH-type transcriptional regulator/antitoxin HigA